MAYTTINKSTDYFNTKLYTGNGSTNAITGVGFQPDLTWIKNRTDASNHNLYDAVRGTSAGKIKSNTTNAESYNAQDLSTFGTDGFTVGGNNEVNGSSDNMVSWNWKANGAGSSNTDGSTTSTVSVNQTAGFSIVKYTGTGSVATVGHGLGAVPSTIFVKSTVGFSDHWFVYHKSNGNTGSIYLNLNYAFAGTGTNDWNSTTPTSSVFTIGTQSGTNSNGATFIAYCFAEKTGYSKFGKYTGNGNADGTFIYTGFKPAWIMVKRTDTTNNWMMIDNKRTPSNTGTVPELFADTTSAENNSTDGRFDYLSNGLKARGTNAVINASGGTYMYMAFGQSLVGSNNIPATAR